MPTQGTNQRPSPFRSGWAWAIILVPAYGFLIWMVIDEYVQKQDIPHYHLSGQNNLLIPLLLPGLSALATIALGVMAYMKPRPWILWNILGIAAFNIVIPLIKSILFFSSFGGTSWG